MDNKKPGRLSGMWGKLSGPRVKYALIGVLSVGFVSGIVFWWGFNTGMEATNSMTFCIGCHEMSDNLYKEYKGSIHYSNRTGVRAVCSDCHVPKDWTHKIIRKVQASKEVWGKLTGVIDTREKFEAHRLEMATREWKRMKANDSRECRNCHNFEAMSEEKQRKLSFKTHMAAKAEGKTCIDCHKGIAHQLHTGYEEAEDK